MEQVLINLLTNAIHASEDGQKIVVSAEKQDEQMLVISVLDSGHGMSEITHEKLFEPFYTTKEVGEGSGLGLSISLGIVESHQGKLTLTNIEPHGVIARVELPQTP